MIDHGYGNVTSTYYGHNGRTTTVVDDLDVRDRVETMLDHTRARLGTSRVLGDPYDPYYGQNVVHTTVDGSYHGF